MLGNANRPATSSLSWRGCFTCCYGANNDDESKGKKGEPVKPPAEKAGGKPTPPTDEPSEFKYRSDAEKAKRNSAMDNASVVTTASSVPKPNSLLAKAQAQSSHPGSTHGSHVSSDSSDEPKDPPMSVPLIVEPSSYDTYSETGSQKTASQVVPSIPPAHTVMEEYEREPDEPEGQAYSQFLDLQSDISKAKFGVVNMTLKYEVKTAVMRLLFTSVDGVIGKADGGPNSYQIRIAILPKRSIRWHTKMIPGPNPAFNETGVLKGLTPDMVSSSALRIRLYGCERRKATKLYGETVLSFASLELKRETAYNIALEPRLNMGHLSIGQLTDIGGSVSSLSNSRLDMRSATPARSNFGSSVDVRLSRAQAVAESNQMQWPELLLSLTYNGTIGKLNVEVIKASQLVIPDMQNRIPDSFVKLTLQTIDGQKITSSKTGVFKDSANPTYQQQFSFDVSQSAIRDVTLTVNVFHKRKLHHHEHIGWFGIGKRNTGDEERDHWEEMLSSHGKAISRWHPLHSVTK